MEETTQPQVDELSSLPQDTGEVSDTTEEPEADQPFLPVKYNKSTVNLDRDKAIEYAQKGMNYDKQNERLAQTTKELEEARKKLHDIESSDLWKLGKTADADPVEGGKSLLSRYFATQDAAVAKEQNITVDEARAQRLKKDEFAQLEAKKKTTEAEISELDAKRRAAQAILEFQKEHPDVDLAALPDEVGERIKRGVPLMDAYELYELKKEKEEMAKQEEIAKTNAKNADASTGKVGGGAEPQGELTKEKIAKMTPGELKKNHNKIWEVLTGERKE